MTHALHIDVESRSTVDLRKTGSAVYFEHPTTDLWSAAWVIGDGPVQLWTPGQPCPDEVFDHVLSGGLRSEEHTSELQSLMRISYAVFCLKKKKKTNQTQSNCVILHNLNC